MEKNGEKRRKNGEKIATNKRNHFSHPYIGKKPKDNLIALLNAILSKED